MPSRRRPISDVYPATPRERAEMAAVLDWITDGEPLTTLSERERHALLYGPLPHQRVPAGWSSN